MRSQAEIEKAVALLVQVPPEVMTPGQRTIRDASLEALRFALGVDDADGSPMSMSFKDYLDGIEMDLEEQHGTSE